MLNSLRLFVLKYLTTLNLMKWEYSEVVVECTYPSWLARLLGDKPNWFISPGNTERQWYYDGMTPLVEPIKLSNPGERMIAAYGGYGIHFVFNKFGNLQVQECTPETWSWSNQHIIDASQGMMFGIGTPTNAVS